MGRVARIPKRRAYHEAGHAVAAVVLKLRLVSVSVIPDKARTRTTIVGKGHSGGRTGIRRLSIPAFEIRDDGDQIGENARRIRRNILLAEGERHAMYRIAGALAEIRHTRGRANKLGVAGDYENMGYELRETLKKIGEARDSNELRAWINRLESNTRALLKQHWRCVEKVAAELLVKHKLSGKYVRELMHR